jgi:predicted nucleic acid-binding Zn ribbon protein
VRKSEDGKPIPLAEALSRYLKRAGLARRIGQASVVDAWPELVGPQIARVTTPEGVSPDGTLRVRVATAAWASELQLMTPQIMARINAGRTRRLKSIRWVQG